MENNVNKLEEIEKKYNEIKEIEKEYNEILLLKEAYIHRFETLINNVDLLRNLLNSNNIKIYCGNTSDKNATFEINLEDKCNLINMMEDRIQLDKSYLDKISDSLDAILTQINRKLNN